MTGVACIALNVKDSQSLNDMNDVSSFSINLLLSYMSSNTRVEWKVESLNFSNFNPCSLSQVSDLSSKLFVPTCAGAVGWRCELCWVCKHC